MVQFQFFRRDWAWCFGQQIFTFKALRKRNDITNGVGLAYDGQ